MIDEPEGLTRNLRIFGVVGILAASIMFLSDCVIMDSSASGSEFGEVALDRLAHSANWRLTLGGIAGPIAACLFIVGFAHVFVALRPGGTRKAFTCAAGLASGYVILGAWHAAGPLIAFIIRLLPSDVHPSSHESWTYMMNLGCVGFVPAAASLLLLPALILLSKSLYPKWFALLTPGILYSCTFVFVYVPAPVGGYLVMGSGSLSFLVFFVASTAVLWQRGNRGIPEKHSAE